MEQVRAKVVESGTFSWPWPTSFGVAVIHGGGGGQGGGATATTGGGGGAGGGATSIRVAGRERISADGGSGGAGGSPVGGGQRGHLGYSGAVHIHAFGDAAQGTKIGIEIGKGGKGGASADPGGSAGADGVNGYVEFISWASE